MTEAIAQLTLDGVITRLGRIWSMNEPLYPGDDVALFIDWENFKISLAVGHRNPNVSALKEEVANHGRVVIAKAYADWVTRSPELRGAGQFINDPPALYAAGIEPVYVPTRLSFGSPSPSGYHRTTRVKNSVDVKMTADCIEIAHSYPNIGTFVLVSGDSDFIHVINTLRTMGKRVIIIGVTWSTSHRLADQVDGLILYDVDVDPVAPQENGVPAAVVSRPANRTSAVASPSYRMNAASLIMGTSMRFTTKPGLSLTLTGVLSRLRMNSSVALKVSSDVWSARITSTRAIMGTGLKKCIPITRSGRPLDEARPVSYTHLTLPTSDLV